MKQKLSKLGYSFDPNELDDVTLQVFAMIGSEIEKKMMRDAKGK